MADFEKMYFQLAGQMADAIDLLQRAMQEGEERLIAESLLTVVKTDQKGKE